MCFLAVCFLIAAISLHLKIKEALRRNATVLVQQGNPASPEYIQQPTPVYPSVLVAQYPPPATPTSYPPPATPTSYPPPATPTSYPPPATPTSYPPPATPTSYPPPATPTSYPPHDPNNPAPIGFAGYQQSVPPVASYPKEYSEQQQPPPYSP